MFVRALHWIPACAGMTIATALAAQPLALDEALRIAEARSPQLAAQKASADAAAALVPAAGQNPDPKLFFGVENVPVDGGEKWSLTSDFMTMRRAGVSQDFIRGEKRETRETKAAAEARRESAIVEMQRADLRRELAMAWFDKLYAERALALVRGLVSEADLQASATTADLAAGKMSAAEPLAARALRATLWDRLYDTERQIRRATALLARWLGDDAARPAGNAPDVGFLPHHESALEGELDKHPHLAMYAPMEVAAQADLRLAEAAKKPDWSVELSYADRGSAFTNLVSLMFRMELPIFQSKRQQPVVASKVLLLEQVRSQAEEARRKHLAEIRAGRADWDAARARVERYRQEIVPLAEERKRAATAAYEGARADLAAVLEARRSLLETKLTQVQAEADLARAWAQLAYVVPQEVH